MKLLFETVYGVLEGFFILLNGIATVVIESLPTILALRKVSAYCTPIGAIALYLGVPIALVSVLWFLIKKSGQEELG